MSGSTINMSLEDYQDIQERLEALEDAIYSKEDKSKSEPESQTEDDDAEPDIEL